MPSSCASLIVALTIVFSSWTCDAVADLREFLSFRVHADGKIEAHTMTLAAVDFVVVKDISFECEIGRAATFHW